MKIVICIACVVAAIVCATKLVKSICLKIVLKKLDINIDELSEECAKKLIEKLKK